ncbi:hypothetical protein COCOR_07545 [Corallococcus coralloides DSM 2259]|uniref:Uncharacterized protein n=1 Tax=Corallococcus coralloides (strain ATCC 25202 / DSM 2259 / NBRC 100086 / M2) TaxID=1144275 RepID=H8MQB2_CORCM|nr:hypothetical protein [Corallococcus coralloides]AFE07589.1 hypothetical protein COCOR_07545 [Corallococcus coralloides DSM 2259]
MFMRWSWVALLLLVPRAGGAQEAVTPEDFDSTVHRLEEAISDKSTSEDEAGGTPSEEEAATSGSAPAWTNLLRMDAATLTLLPRQGEGPEEGFVQLEPMVALGKGEALRLILGAPVRLRLWGGGDGAGAVRKEDWDTLSDWGQVVRLFMVGGDTPDSVWLGMMEGYSLLSGHLVRRYGNRINPDAHPAGVIATVTLGPAYAELFASDVLSARLTGAEVALDVQHVLFGRPSVPGRYTLALSAVHDWGQVGGTSRSLTLAHLDATAVVLRRGRKGQRVEAHLLGGWGGRPGMGGAWGAVVGVGVDALTPTVDLRARLEGRLQRGGFRQGTFGPDYELARLQVAGPATVPLAEASFPEGYSAYGEVILSWDAVRLSGMRQRHLFLSLGVEAFSWGRVDVDGRVETQLFHRDFSLGVSGLAAAMGLPGARYLVSGEARWRFLGGNLYALGQGGRLLFPTPEGTPRPGTFAAVGLGVDNAR